MCFSGTSSKDAKFKASVLPKHSVKGLRGDRVLSCSVRFVSLEWSSPGLHAFLLHSVCPNHEPACIVLLQIFAVVEPSIQPRWVV